MKRRLVVQKRAIVCEQESSLFQRLIASTLSITIFASTLIIQYAQAQIISADEVTAPKEVPQDNVKKIKKINISPELGTGAGLNAGEILSISPGKGDGAAAGFTLGESAGASAGPLLVWAPGPGPGVRTIAVIPDENSIISKIDNPAVKSIDAERSVALDSQEVINPVVSGDEVRAQTQSQMKASNSAGTERNLKTTTLIPKDTTAVAGMRLSEWLIQDQRRKQLAMEMPATGVEQPKVAKGPDAADKPEPYLFGMAWIVPSEVPSQTKQKDMLLEALQKMNAPNKEPSFDKSREALRNLIQSMPVTGRALLPTTSARYLEVNPRFDPILQTGEEIRIPLTPNSITVIRSDGLLCKVLYQPNVETRQYYRACRPQSVVADRAWVIEPDGKIRVVPTADWNEAKQDLPAPGAWIWAPPRGSGWSDSDANVFSEQLAIFLSTQEVSGDALSPDNEVNLRRPPIMSVDERYTTSRDLPLTRSIWGDVGLLETPSARIAPAGTASFGISNANPYQQLNFSLTPVDFIEFGFRYANINNIPYGSYSSQTYKDKSADIKFRLWKESAYLPEIAVGARDFLGTGLFSGEYLMSNKRVSNFDFSAGIGWGYLGSRNNIPNPLKYISSSYSTRAAPVVGSGGNLTGNYFSGNAAMMGGVQYHTPIDGLIFKAELDGNNYQHEPFYVTLPTKTPFNFGAVYQTKLFDWTVGLRGGNTLMLALNFHDRLDQLTAPKLAEVKSIPVELKAIGTEYPTRLANQASSVVSSSYNPNRDYGMNSRLGINIVDPPNVNLGKLGVKLPNNTVATVTPSPSPINQSTRTVSVNTQKSSGIATTQTMLDVQTQTGWQVDDIRMANNTWIVKFNDSSGVYISERIDQGVAVLQRDAPPDIQNFQLQFYNQGLLVSDFQVDRIQWMLSQTQLLPPSQKKPIIRALSSEEVAKLPPSSVLDRLDHKPYHASLGLDYFQVIGGPDTPLLFAVSATGTAVYKFDKNTWLTGTLSTRLIDNFGKFTYQPPPTGLQPVRTDIRQYMTTSVLTMPNLQGTKTFQFSGDQFASVYAGYLEMMFAGAGGEYLYRPNNSRFAIGADLNRVSQRQFNQWTSLQNYSVNTGHVTGYWDTGAEDILVKFSVGQYLAGDRGGTLDLSRVFQNGVKIGAYVTRTNVNYAQFGEGSFDKGVYIAVPFNAFFAARSDSVADLLWTPLIRDGGAMLNRKYSLYNITSARDGRALSTGKWELAE